MPLLKVNGSFMPAVAVTTHTDLLNKLVRVLLSPYDCLITNRTRYTSSTEAFLTPKQNSGNRAKRQRVSIRNRNGFKSE